MKYVIGCFSAAAAMLVAALLVLTPSAAQQITPPVIQGTEPPEITRVPGPQLELVGPRPDLIFYRTTLRSAPEQSYVTTGAPYAVCYEILNVGTRVSGPFRVTGSGGGPSIPSKYRDHAGLPVGYQAGGCLSYPTAPSPGNYQVRLDADSLQATLEKDETNNTIYAMVTILPH